jgi:hypothetical protein
MRDKPVFAMKDIHQGLVAAPNQESNDRAHAKSDGHGFIGVIPHGLVCRL